MAAIYDLKSQARCLAAVEGDADRNRFIASTINLRVANELHVLEFDEDTTEVTVLAVHPQPHETWDLASCPAAAHASKLLTVLNDPGSTHYAALTSVPALGDSDVTSGERAMAGAKEALPELLRLAPAPSEGGLLRRALWNPSGDASTALTCQPGALRSWPVDGGAGASETSLEAVCWDAHHAQTVAVGSSNGALATVDLRTMKQAALVRGAHNAPIRTLSYNPNRPYVILSGGEDRAVRFWDLRRAGGQPDSPSASPIATPALLELAAAHAHWVTAACYNRFHDQLVLTAGTDAEVKLWRAAAISSAPPTADTLDDEAGEGESESDGLVRALNDHEESVYAAVWSAADAWLFGSLSFDGRIAVNYVPAAEKYRILL